jgi:hypothetical protein
MRSTRPVYFRILSLLLTLLISLFALNVIAAASDEEEGESYDEKARVVRVSLIKGEITLKRQGNNDWERARLNFPLVEGDTLATDRESQVEIQIDARNFVRVGSSSMVRILTLRDEGIALSVIEGTASIRLAKFDRDQEISKSMRLKPRSRPSAKACIGLTCRAGVACVLPSPVVAGRAFTRKLPVSHYAKPAPRNSLTWYPMLVNGSC